MAPNMETIPVTLDKPRALRLTFRELAAVARYHPGENPLALIDQLLVRTDTHETPTFAAGNLWALQVLLWAALRWDDPTLTVDNAADLITSYVRTGTGNLADLAALVYSAWYVGGLRPPDSKKNVEAEAAMPETA